MTRKHVSSRVFIPALMLIVWMMAAGGATAAPQVGRSSADFLHIGVGARAAGLGGAYTAVAEGAIAAYWNPAGLASIEKGEISFGHFSWYQDITVEQGSIAYPVSSRAAIGASITYVNYGTIDGYDVNGVSTGELSAYDWAAGLSFSYALNESFSAGLTGKFVNQRLDEFNASAFAGDFGLKYQFPSWAVAVSVANIGTKLTFDQESEKLPSAVRFGVAGRPFEGLMLASLDLEKRLDGEIFIRQGVEFEFGERYYLRSGYDYFPAGQVEGAKAGISFGGGIDFDFAAFDYAFSPNDKSTTEDLHRFSVVFKLGR